MSREAPSVKRLLREAKQLAKSYDKNGDIAAAPVGDGDNLFEWRFTIRGPDDSVFEDGIYHGRLVFPPQYPMKPPDIFLLTPNGRFETNVKICLSISGYHPETWLPSWSVATALRALQAFFVTPAKGAIGGLEYPEAERRRLAKKSVDWESEDGIKMRDILNVREKSSKISKTIASVNETSSAKKEESETVKNEKTSKEDKIRKAISEKERIELELYKRQVDYRSSDISSLVFMLFIIGCIAYLFYRRLV